MSILDKASLIQIPSGYKSTKLYSLRPSNGDGDFTFARSSSATRVNSEGLIETAQVLGSELVVNGDFASDSDWTKTGLVTIANGVASFVDNGTNTNTGISQNILTANKTYKITFDITRYVAGNLQFVIGATTHSYNISSGVGSYVVYYNVTGSGSTNLFRLKRWGSYPNFDFDVDNVSVKEVIENDVPRLDYSGGASCASLLLEGQSTNTVTYSEDFSQLTSKSNITITDNQVISPDGTLNAASFIDNSTSGAHRAFTIYSSSIASGQLVSHSIFAKAKEHKWFQLSTGGSTNDQWANFDLENGVIGNSSSSANPIIENYGNGWYRCILFATTSATNASLAGLITLTNNLDATLRSPSYSGSNGGVYVFGLQIEQGSYATSYIPSNSGSSTTRTADVCNNAGTSATFNDSEGVLFAEISAFEGANTDRQISISDGSTSNRVAIAFLSNNTQIQFVVVSGGSVTVNTTQTITTITSGTKIAFAYKANDFKIYANGSLIASDTSGAVPTGINTLAFDKGDGTGDVFYGKTKQLMTFNEALSDEELSDLTGQVNLSFNNLATFYNYTIL